MKKIFALVALVCTALTCTAAPIKYIEPQTSLLSLSDKNTAGNLVNLIEDSRAKTLWIVTHADHSSVVIDQIALAAEMACSARRPALKCELRTINPGGPLVPGAINLVSGHSAELFSKIAGRDEAAFKIVAQEWEKHISAEALDAPEACSAGVYCGK